MWRSYFSQVLNDPDMVLKRFLKSKLSSHNVHSLPPGQRVYAIGDLHGRLDLLERMLEKVEQDSATRGFAERTLVFLGDLVDRGPDSQGVIQRLLEIHESGINVRFLVGNHDEVFLKAACGDLKALRFLTKIGGKETILSYGIGIEEYHSADYEELSSRLVKAVPKAHKDFLASFENYVEIGDYLFVHAGIRPGVEIAKQALTDLRWIRGEFLDHRDHHGVMVVHGHSISAEPEVRSNRLGIDTGGFASGRLTAVGLENKEHWFLCALAEPDPRWGSVTD